MSRLSQVRGRGVTPQRYNTPAPPPPLTPFSRSHGGFQERGPGNLALDTRLCQHQTSRKNSIWNSEEFLTGMKEDPEVD